ncbi:MAG: 50S ribosome-binding GTPase [Bacteriovoracaceae bacterium]|nr:50S ribosome-binding GTPase [Bacteriovoracaceae bacterium]
MEWLYGNEPIVACSSGNLENTAITVIRLSGFDNLSELNSFFDKDTQKFCPHRTIFCHLIEPCTQKRLDQVVCTYFEGPKSYNGENILEVSVHGNRLNVNRIISAFVEHGPFRKAAPGEFTYRALKNKKLSLSQVEGLDMLLNSSSNYSADQGLEVLCGEINDKYLQLEKAFLNLRSHFELNIDFAEDVGEEVAEENFHKSFYEFHSLVTELNKRIGVNSNLVLSPEIVLYGAVNAGKSSLFNLLLSNERSIVSSIKGTTRDYVSENLVYKDIEFKLIDTAGLRETENEIESEGIKRGLKKVDKAFFNVFVINPFDDINNDSDFKNTDLIIFTHCDQEGFEQRLSEFTKIIKTTPTLNVSLLGGPIEPAKSGPIEPVKSGPIEPAESGPIEPVKSGPIEPVKSGPIEPVNSGPIEPVNSGPIEPVMFYSTEKQVFTAVMDQCFTKYSTLISDKPLLVERHVDVLKALCVKSELFAKLLKSESDLGILSNEINGLAVDIAELLGTIPPDQVLGNIFENFCIGK